MRRRARPTTPSPPAPTSTPGSSPTESTRRRPATRSSPTRSQPSCTRSAGSDHHATRRPSMKTASSLLAAAVLAGAAFAAHAQDNVFKIGVTRYDTHAKTNGISGIGVPPGADAKVGDATTVILVYERLFGPNLGAELVMGIPPTIKAKASGSAAFLNATGTVLSTENWAPTLLFNYHFFEPGATWRPYVGLGINYTQFRNVKSSIA